MKTTHVNIYQQSHEAENLLSLLVSKRMLETKTRINLYLSVAVVKLIDSLAQKTSRGKLISDLVIKEAAAKQTSPYGLFSGAKIDEQDIEQIISGWQKSIVHETV